MEPAAFLNLDLELESNQDLEAFEDHFSSRAFVLLCGRVGDRYEFAAEPLAQGSLLKDPVSCTDHFLSLLESLPQNLKDLLDTCDHCVFDYGFDGGMESVPFAALLTPQQLARIAALGFSLRVTVYPYSSNPAEDAPDA